MAAWSWAGWPKTIAGIEAKQSTIRNNADLSRFNIRQSYSASAANQGLARSSASSAIRSAMRSIRMLSWMA